MTQIPSKSNTVQSHLFKGLRWTGASQTLQQILNLAFSIVMARLLSPEDFGLLAMACVFTGVVFLVLDLGLGTAVVQAPTIEERQISSIFWMSVIAGVIMTLAGVLFSGAIAAFYQNPAVQPIIVGLSFNFFIFSLGSTQQALLMRQMNFASLELRNLGGHIVGTACAIVMAFWGFGVWSLVARILITGVVNTMLLWTASSWRPAWSLRRSDVQQFIGFSTDVMSTNVLTYVGRNADNLLIGRFVGVVELGYYALAYNAMRLPVQRFTQVLVQVLFPALSRLQEDPEKVKRNWFRANRLTAAVIIPLMLGLVALAPQFVQVVYGQRWLPVVPILQVLAIAGIFQSLHTLSSTLLLAVGQTRLRLKLTVLAIVLAVISFVVGLPYGILGVATCFTIVSTATAAFSLYKTLKCVGSNYMEYFRNLAGVLAAAGMELVVLMVLNLPMSPALGVTIRAALSLGIATLLGGAVYLVLLRLIAPLVLQEALSILPKRSVKQPNS